MGHHTHHVLREKPLQTCKFGGILLALVLSVAGFFRLIDARLLIDNPFLGDGQFLALVLLPVLSVGLILLVVLEALVTGYRLLRSDEPIRDSLTKKPGYILIRGIEAAVAVVGVGLIFGALPPLFAQSTPAPAGVGIMLLVFVVGLSVLVASLVRSSVELFVYPDYSVT